MRKLMIGITATAACLVAVATASTGAASRGVSPSTVTVFSKQTANSLVDADGSKSPTPGDLAVTTWDNYTGQGGKKIGTGTSVCTLVKAPAMFSCVGSDTLLGGNFMEQCTIVGPVSCAIVGGTGTYAGWHGVIDARPLDAKGTKLVVTFRRLTA
jgi:hypothetical protein